MPRAGFEIAGERVPPGGRASLTLPLPGQSAYTPLSMPVQVVHGRKNGPVMLLSAAIHGDEINGIEIIRQVLASRTLARLRGTLLCIPIVNVYGFLHHTRYLPDRRDLNRSFPGSAEGSLTARVAHTFVDQILSRVTHGIDLHTGANHRTNLPHIRADLKDPETERLARAFGTPVIIAADLRDGSLRQYAKECGIPMLLYEAGEALRFDPVSIRAGVRGVVNVLRALDMLPPGKSRRAPRVMEAQSSRWIRAGVSGLLRTDVRLGEAIEANQRLGVIADALGGTPCGIQAPHAGIVIGQTKLPAVNEGDALFHIARFANTSRAGSAVEAWTAQHIEGLGEGDYVEPAGPGE